jgi:hypothetical protein
MNARLFVLLFFTVVIGFLSCKDKDLPPPAIARTTLNVSNATAGGIKYYINGTRQNDLAVIISGGSTGYLYVPGGTQLYKFSNAYGDFSTLFTNTYTLDTSRFYSMFVCGATADKTFKIDDPFIVADTIIANDTLNLKAIIRFVNASPDAGNLDFTVNKGDTVSLKSYKFQDWSTYLGVNAGKKEIKVYPAGSSTPSIDTMLTFSPHVIYTLFTKGSSTGTGNAAFSINVSSAVLSN